jgi:hypothetical protein
MRVPVRIQANILTPDRDPARVLRRWTLRLPTYETQRELRMAPSARRG